MGGGSSSSHSGTSASISDNLPRIKREFPVSPSGYIGNGSRSGRVTTHSSHRPRTAAERLFAFAGRGGELRVHKDGRGMTTLMKDGGTVTLRLTSHSDGSPTVQISSGSQDSRIPKSQKIHFIPEGAK